MILGRESCPEKQLRCGRHCKAPLPRSHVPLVTVVHHAVVEVSVLVIGGIVVVVVRW